MGGPTNTTPRYRPPPPGTAPPPPPASDGQQAYQQDPYSQAPPMGGQPPPPNSFYQQQVQHQYQPTQQQQQQYPPSSAPPAPASSYYTQPQPPPSQPPARPAQGSYAARSAAAHSPHGSVHATTDEGNAASPSPQGSAHGNAPNKPSATDPHYEQEQSRLLAGATRKLVEVSHGMQRAMEANDAVTVLEMACLLLEELGDPNHGVKAQGGTGARTAGGYGTINPNTTNPYVPNPPYYGTAGGAVPPLGNYGGHNPYPHHHHPGGGHGALIPPLSPKNYYELHMRAMDELPPLEEYLLNLCHVPTASNAAQGGPTNLHHSHQMFSTAQFTPGQLDEAVQYCPRVVPRLYLQICMGSVSIRSGWREAVDVMKELGEAAKCVQCPVRGLFLRYFLLMALKDKLPDGADEWIAGGSGVAKPALGGGSKSMVENAPTAPPPLVPPPSFPPPPPPVEESLISKNTTLFPEEENLSTLFPEQESLLSKNTTLFPEQQEIDLFGDLASTPLFSEPVTGPSPLENYDATAAPSSPLRVHPPASSDPTLDSAPTPSDSTTPSPTEGPHKGTVKDSYEFILQNLFEMNRLWIRIQHMPGDKTKETKRRRERERNDLRILVGSNLNRLSQLEGISARTYGSCILPRILEEVASCRDALAQAYLMDCIIQVFPDEFHLETLEVFLGVLPKLKDKVNVRTILNNMMERLLHYYREEKLVNDEVDTNNVKRTMAMHSFDMFEDCVKRVFEARGLGIPPKDVIRLQGLLLGYTLKVAPGNIDHISRCIGLCARELGTLQEQKKASMMGQGIVVGGVTRQSMELDMDEVAITELEKLLSVPLDQIALKVLNIPEFSSLLSFLPWENRRKVATSMLKAVVTGGQDANVKSVSEEEQLFAIIAPLLRDEGFAPPGMYDNRMEEGGSLISRTANLMGTLGISPSVMSSAVFAGGATHSKGYGSDPAKIAQFREEQTLVAKLVHVLEHEDTDVTYQMLNVARKYLQPGGAERVSVTMPALVFALLKLLGRVQQLEFPSPKEQRVHDTDTIPDKGEKGETDAYASKDEAMVSDTATKDSITAGKTTMNGDNATHEDGMIGGINAEENGEVNGITTEHDELDTGKKNVIQATSDEPIPLFVSFSKSVTCRKILVFLQKSVAMLATNCPELAFKLYLEIAVATDLLAFSTRSINQNSSAEFSGIAYDFMTQALLVYEDEISESKAQVRSITSIVGSLLSCSTFERADYEALITKTAQYAAKLLKKPDQCRMVCLCSRLFYVCGKDDASVYRNPQRVLECLQRSLKIADACSMASSTNLILFVEILDYYVYYYEIENPAITDKFVSGLIALINEHFSSVGSMGSAAVEEAKAYYAEVLKSINKRKREKDTADRFSLIVC